MLTVRSRAMPDPAAEIIDRLFTRAEADPESAPLAPQFTHCYRSGRWTADSLDERLRAYVEDAAANRPDGEEAWS